VNILIVEDDHAQAKSLSMGLRSEGFCVFQAHTANEALKVLDSEPIDVAIVDIMMPVVNGLELGRVIRDSYPEVKLVLISAYHISRRQVLLSNTNAVAFVPKPYNFECLVEFLKNKISFVDSSDPVVVE